MDVATVILCPDVWLFSREDHVKRFPRVNRVVRVSDGWGHVRYLCSSIRDGWADTLRPLAEAPLMLSFDRSRQSYSDLSKQMGGPLLMW